MTVPEYEAPTTLEEALGRLSQAAGDAQIIAGGTDLLPRIRAGTATPTLLIDLRRLDLAEVRQEGDFVYLGAQLTHTQLLESSLLREQFPALVAACREVGGPSIRNRGTLGGNLVNASPAADTAPPLLVYDAEVLLVSDGTERWLPLAGFFVGPGQTALRNNEIVKEIRLPATRSGKAAAFSKLGKRQAMAIAVVSVAVRLSVNEKNQIDQARIALGSVAPRPIQATAAEKVLLGRPVDESSITAAASIAASESAPISDIRAGSDYRRRMVEVFVRRSLTSAWHGLRTERDDD